MGELYDKLRDPTEAEFSAAAEIVTRYVQAPESGWDKGRNARVHNQLKAWGILLSDNERHAAHDAEKD